MNLKIIMYHYVRPIKCSHYPGIKGLELDGFIRQLDFFQEEFTVVTVDQIISFIKKGIKLPENACWLTFDDGYKDHYDYVLPELITRGLQGSFFPPAQAVVGNALLDVNALHYVLAEAPGISSVRKSLDSLCVNNGMEDHLREYWKTYAVANRFDDAETIYVKRMLQHVLPERLRRHITNELFEKYVGRSCEEFSSELYMKKDEVVELVKSGMYVGSHGNCHCWLDKLSPSEQTLDIKCSLEFLEDVNAPTDNWVVCYPYGSYNADTLQIVKNMGAILGLTTIVSEANLTAMNLLELPRFDTNDYPQ